MAPTPEIRPGQIWHDADPRSPHLVRVLDVAGDVIAIQRPRRRSQVQRRHFLRRFCLVKEGGAPSMAIPPEECS